jgi:hypothetical protein
MRKLRLEIDDLEVETFSVQRSATLPRGTVQGAYVNPGHKEPVASYDESCSWAYDCSILSSQYFDTGCACWTHNANFTECPCP